MSSPAKIRRDESARAEIPARSFKCFNKSLFLYLNVYVFGSGSPVELQDTRYELHKYYIEPYGYT